MDYQRYLGAQPVDPAGQAQHSGQGVDPIKAALFGAPPAPAIPAQQPAPMPPVPQMPNVGEPGGFGPAIFRLANFIRQYGQQARQRRY